MHASSSTPAPPSAMPSAIVVGLHPLPTHLAPDKRVSREMKNANILAPCPRFCKFLVPETIPGVPWSYPENFNAIVNPIPG